MKILILILLPFLIKSQNTVINTLLNDVSLHTQAGINLANLGASSITYFQYQVCKKVKLSLSLLGGFTTGVVITNVKEDVWDDYLQKGTKDNKDRFNGYWGSLLGTITYIPGHNKWFEKPKKYLDFN